MILAHSVPPPMPKSVWPALAILTFLYQIRNCLEISVKNPHLTWLGSIQRCGGFSRYRLIGLWLVVVSWEPWNLVIFIRLNILVLVLISNMSIFHILGISNIKTCVVIGLDRNSKWRQTNFNFKTSLDIGIEMNLKSRQVLVLALSKIRDLAELWLRCNLDVT